MQKINRKKSLLVFILLIALLAMYGATPGINVAQAASLQDASDLLSDSDIGQSNVTHTITVDFGSNGDLLGGQRIQVDLSAVTGIGLGSGDITCASGTTASSTGWTSSGIFECVVGGADLSSTTDHVIKVATTTNPGIAGDYTVTISTLASTTATVIETSQVKIYIIDDVQVTASVDASLSFAINAVNGDDNTVLFDNVTCDATSTASTTPFGTLPTTGTTTVCQQLEVSTNADTGFFVAIVQDDELTSAAGANINSFNNSPDGTGSSTLQAWESPTAELGKDNTYGHMGVTSSDDDAISSNQYFGLETGSSSQAVMSYTGPVDGSNTPSQGQAYVAYVIEISDMQEAGDYTSNISYICTPTY